jgi:hypothetical protein
MEQQLLPVVALEGVVNEEATREQLQDVAAAAAAQPAPITNPAPITPGVEGEPGQEGGVASEVGMAGVAAAVAVPVPVPVRLPMQAEQQQQQQQQLPFPEQEAGGEARGSALSLAPKSGAAIESGAEAKHHEEGAGADACCGGSYHNHGVDAAADGAAVAGGEGGGAAAAKPKGKGKKAKGKKAKGKKAKGKKAKGKKAKGKTTRYRMPMSQRLTALPKGYRKGASKGASIPQAPMTPEEAGGAAQASAASKGGAKQKACDPCAKKRIKCDRTPGSTEPCTKYVRLHGRVHCHGGALPVAWTYRFVASLTHPTQLRGGEQGQVRNHLHQAHARARGQGRRRCRRRGGGGGDGCGGGGDG